MAIIRCQTHTPTGRTRSYVALVRPVGYPETALVCGSVSCVALGLIWLEETEKLASDRAERMFNSFTATVKMRAI